MSEGWGHDGVEREGGGDVDGFVRAGFVVVDWDWRWGWFGGWWWGGVRVEERERERGDWWGVVVSWC